MPYEKKWIAKQLKIYEIKYAEIYNEVYDHILAACDDKRHHGDARAILSLFQETMDQDIGSHAGIAQMTAEREDSLKTILKSSFNATFKSYLNSAKLTIPFGIACITYIMAEFSQLNVKWLVVMIVITSWSPNFYLLIVGTKNGYLRTIRSKRKTSLVNHLMFEMTRSTISIVYLIFFGIPSLSALLGTSNLTDPTTTNKLISFLGYPGLAILIALVTIYAFTFIKVAKTDYRQLIQQVLH